MEQFNISQNKVEEYDEEKTLQITRKEIKIDEDIEMNSTVSASECFKSIGCVFAGTGDPGADFVVSQCF